LSENVIVDVETIEALPMPATYAHHLLRLFDGGRLLAGTGLRASDLEDPELLITVGQALQYIRNTEALAEDPAWYLAWATTLTDHFHGLMSIALLSAPSLGDGVDAFLRFFPSRIPYMHMQGRREGDRFVAELCPVIELGSALPLLVETPLIILQQHLETVYDIDFADAVLELDYPSTPHAHRYADYFRCPVRFRSSRNGLVFPETWRALGNLGHIPSTWAYALAQCEATMASSRERETLGQVKHLLCRAFEDPGKTRPLPTLSAVAKDLHVAPRTLIRRLRALGTSYQAITDEFLQVRARELLANGEVSVKEVAAALGFGDPANFGKAFKRWYGVSPGAYRRERHLLRAVPRQQGGGRH
jgi:AraC-like DNA-binding protein